MASTKAQAAAPTAEMLARLFAGREEIVPLSRLAPDEKNARLHNERNRAVVRESLKDHGQVEPVVAQAKARRRKHRIIGGNCRYGEMQTLGWTHCKVLFLDVDDATADALALRLNRSSELGEWNFQTLAGLMRELPGKGFDLESLGWLAYETEPLINTSFITANVGEMPTGSGSAKTRPIVLNREQREVIDRAIAKARQSEGDDAMTDGRALELICNHFLA